MTDLQLKSSALNVQVNSLLIVIQYGQFEVEHNPWPSVNIADIF